MNKLLFFLLVMLPMSMRAQDDPEYRMEIGAGMGLDNYLGDFNQNLMHGMQPASGVVARYVFNPYMAMKFNFTYGKIKGSSKDTETFFPHFQTESLASAGNKLNYHFDKTLVDVSFTYEYNFWPYGTGRDYRGAQRLVPYVFGGLGFTYVKGENWTGNNRYTGTANIPLGLGVKYKAAPRFNIGFEYAMHFSMSDKLDSVEDPYIITSSGLFKNKDSYGMLMFSVTYSFWEKCRVCNKE